MGDGRRGGPDSRYVTNPFDNLSGTVTAATTAAAATTTITTTATATTTTTTVAAATATATATTTINGVMTWAGAARRSQGLSLRALASGEGLTRLRHSRL
jgi:hypothetical protein